MGTTLSEAALQAVAQLGAIALERARAQEAANHAEATRQNEQLKATLLDALAHEFKTPLTSIKAAITSILTNSEHDPVERELLTVADEEADRLTTLLTRTIEVARIEAGHVKLSRQPCPVAQLVADAIDQLKRFCEGRDVRVDVPPDLPPVDADPGLIALVLRQLLDNALKYASPSASIGISAERSEDNVIVHVFNDGPGIAPEEFNSIFQKFYRGRDVRDRIPGTGLGLTIAREIVATHGGNLTVSSQPGIWRTFLLYAAGGARRGDGRGPMSVSPAKILVVDDEPQIRRVLRASLSAHGYVVSDARSGEEALLKIREERFDLILLDVNMPGMGGLEACRADPRRQRSRHHHADGAQCGAGQSGRARRRRRRLRHQALRHDRSCWRASAPTCGASRFRRPAVRRWWNSTGSASISRRIALSCAAPKSGSLPRNSICFNTW